MKIKYWLLTSMFILFAVILIAGCNKSGQKNEEPEKILGDSSIVRDRNISVASLDKNGDGFVFQCAMHTNIISDDSTECAVCLMGLEKISVAEAQQNIKQDKNHNN